MSAFNRRGAVGHLIVWFTAWFYYYFVSDQVSGARVFDCENVSVRMQELFYFSFLLGAQIVLIIIDADLSWWLLMARAFFFCFLFVFFENVNTIEIVFLRREEQALSNCLFGSHYFAFICEITEENLKSGRFRVDDSLRQVHAMLIDEFRRISYKIEVRKSGPHKCHNL